MQSKPLTQLIFTKRALGEHREYAEFHGAEECARAPET
jgi:hypothetical protein